MATGDARQRYPNPFTRRAGPLLALLVLAVASGSAAAKADLWVKEKVTGGDGKALGERTWTFAPGKLRLDGSGGGLLLDADQQKGWIYGGADGGCVALPFPLVPSTRAAARTNASEIESFNASLQAVAGTAGTLTPRGEKRTIAAVEADRYEISGAGGVLQERWIASSVQNPDLDAIVNRLTESNRLSSLMTVPAVQVMVGSVGLGYPVRVHDLGTGVVTEAVEIRTAKQPASAFSVPAACAGQ